MKREYDCRQCGLPHAPDKGQLCGSCAQHAKAEAHARMVREEIRNPHAQRQQYASMFGGNRHQRRMDQVRLRSQRHQ